MNKQTFVRLWDKWSLITLAVIIVIVFVVLFYSAMQFVKADKENETLSHRYDSNLRMWQHIKENKEAKYRFYNFCLKSNAVSNLRRGEAEVYCQYNAAEIFGE